ncbi:hypothetical protein [Ereboglobus luteus]|uniref:hypothetical protein n=1 Tax=Ereboglobus luteus TaxID=1796921 RepID=UPI001F2A38FD|nr:hypothetical protein [Ereboglobus luteus]
MASRDSSKYRHPARLLLIILSCFLYAGCASSTSKEKPEPWSGLARKIDVPREELEAIANDATKAHDLVARGMRKEEDGGITVLLAESRIAPGVMLVFYKKTNEGWVVDKNGFFLGNITMKKWPKVSRKNW